MGSENCRNINTTFATERESNASEPFVEVNDDSFGRFMRNKLKLVNI
jgi:hypothetical protein